MPMKLASAATIVDVALSHGRSAKFEPLTVVILDAGGHLVAAKRDDRSGILRFEIAFGKAYGALGMGFGSRELAVRAEKVPVFMGSLAAASGGRLIPAPSGVLILQEGEIIGAIGISGDTADNDEACALAGIAAVGLDAKVGA